MLDFMKSGLKTNDSVRLTPVGQTKAKSCGQDTAQARVLDALAENQGVATIGEIASEARLSEKETRNYVEKLMRAGYITKQGKTEI